MLEELLGSVWQHYGIYVELSVLVGGCLVFRPGKPQVVKTLRVSVIDDSSYCPSPRRGGPLSLVAAADLGEDNEAVISERADVLQHVASHINFWFAGI